MSRVGVWPLVVEDIRARARAAAAGGDVCRRMGAYAELCQEIGGIASYYAARSYQEVRKGALVG